MIGHVALFIAAFVAAAVVALAHATPTAAAGNELRSHSACREAGAALELRYGR